MTNATETQVETWDALRRGEVVYRGLPKSEAESYLRMRHVDSITPGPMRPARLVSLESAARAYMHGGMFTPEEAAARAYADSSSIMHAVRDLYAEAIADGRIPFDTCSFCGGSSPAGVGDHHLCAARFARGLPTPRLDGAISPCSCYPCMKGRGEA